MKRRRDLGPKKQKNTAALKRFILWAVVAAVAGSLLAWLAHYLLGLLPTRQDSEKGLSLIRQLPGMLLIVTSLTVLALLFFGTRAYLMGLKVRHTLQNKRMKIKRS